MTDFISQKASGDHKLNDDFFKYFLTEHNFVFFLWLNMLVGIKQHNLG